MGRAGDGWEIRLFGVDANCDLAKLLGSMRRRRCRHNLRGREGRAARHGEGGGQGRPQTREALPVRPHCPPQAAYSRVQPTGTVYRTVV